MAYILDLLNGAIEPKADRISLERFVVEDSYITKYLSRVVRDNALAVYHVLFHLSWFETGKGEVIVPWAKVGGFIRSDQGNIIALGTVKRRLADLFQNKCITVNRQRGGANEIIVHLPSEIPACKELIETEESAAPQPERPDERDYFTDPERRLEILKRDGRICAYCRLELSEDSFVLDHLIPIAKGGTSRRFNLVTSCQPCNERKQDQDPIQFLLSNYRSQLLSQQEFMGQKSYIEELLDQGKEAGKTPG